MSVSRTESNREGDPAPSDSTTAAAANDDAASVASMTATTPPATGAGSATPEDVLVLRSHLITIQTQKMAAGKWLRCSDNFLAQASIQSKSREY